MVTGTQKTAALERVPLVALGILGLLTGLWAGLARMGWALPLPRPDLALAHGPLMVGGFLGTVIGLERAVALKAGWGYLSPAASAGAVVALLLGAPEPVAPLLVLFASAVLLGMSVTFIRRQPTLAELVMAGGAVVWCVGNFWWLMGRSLSDVFGWWISSLVLAVVGERLLLSRIVTRSRASTLLYMTGVLVIAASLLLWHWNNAASARVAGGGMVFLSVWMLRYDIARKNLKQAGLSRFIALCLLSAAVWLGIGGVLFGAFGHPIAGVRYDAALHAVTVGFVISMIFGHAPLVFPAVLGVKMAYRRAFYAHLVLLHASLVLRIAADLSGSLDGRRIGGLLNALAIVLFIANTAYSVLSARRERC